MMATLPHVTSGSGLREFQADGFLFDRVYLSHFEVQFPGVSITDCFSPPPNVPFLQIIFSIVQPSLPCLSN